MSGDDTTTSGTPTTGTRPRVGGPAGGPGQGPPSGIPARGTTRPPFPEGNALHLSHGATSPRIVSGVARDLAAGLLDRRPDLVTYPDAVERWATASAVSLLLIRWIDDVGIIDPEKNAPRKSVLLLLGQSESRAERAGMLLGLDPRSEAALAKDRAATAHLAVDIEAILARGREANAAREVAGLPPLIPERDAVAVAAVAAVTEEGRKRWEAANAEHLGHARPDNSDNSDDSDNVSEQ